MKTRLICLLVFIISTVGVNAQKYYLRTNGTTTPVDPHLGTTLSFKIPVIADTASALTAAGIDSMGLIFKETFTSKLWIRDTVLTGGHKWTLIQSSGGGNDSSAVWGYLTGVLSDQTDLWTILQNKQNVIGLGSTSQYFRGDLSLATFPTNLSSFTNDVGFIDSIMSQYSIQGNGLSGNKLQLVGDQSGPGATKYYGTNSGGSKGWYSLPSGTGTVTSITAASPITGGVITATGTIGADTSTSNTGLTTLYQSGLRVKYSDTASMLSAYLRSALGVKYTDTASMLTPYLRSTLASSTYATISNLALKVNISDTSSMLSPYIRGLLAVKYSDSTVKYVTPTQLNPYKLLGVDTIYRTIGKDSLQFVINGRYHSILDSAGGGGGGSQTLSQTLILGNTANTALVDTAKIKTLDSADVAFGLTHTVLNLGDSSVLFPSVDTIVTMGTSIETGFLLRDTSWSYLSDVCRAYGSYNYNVGAYVGGKLVPDMVTNISLIPTYRSTFKYLFFEFGLNDTTTALNFTNNYERIIDSAIINRGWPANKIVILSAPFGGASHRVDSIYSNAAAVVATAKGTKYVDLYHYSLTHLYISNMQADSLHPKELAAKSLRNCVLTTLKDSVGALEVNNLQIDKTMSVQGLASFRYPTTFLGNIVLGPSDTLVNTARFKNGVLITGDGNIVEQRWLAYNSGGTIFGEGVGNGGSGPYFMEIYGGQTGGGVQLGTMASNVFTPTISATSTGLGIFNKSPSHALDVTGTANVTGLTNLQEVTIAGGSAASLTGTQWNIYTSGNSHYGMGVSNSTGTYRTHIYSPSNQGGVDLGVVDATGGSTYTSILSVSALSGVYRVGVNQTTPTHSLDVTGDINATTNLIVGGEATITGGSTVSQTKWNILKNSNELYGFGIGHIPSSNYWLDHYAPSNRGGMRFGSLDASTGTIFRPYMAVNNPDSTILIGKTVSNGKKLQDSGTAWINDTLTLPNIALKAFDTSNYKIAVTDALGNIFKMNWPSSNVGTVTSVAQSVPTSLLSISGSPITSSGTLAIGLTNAAAHSYWGNNTGSSAAPSYLTNTQLTADLNLFSSSLQGLAPSSGGGTTNFLRADGSWSSPVSGYALLASPTFTGTPSLPTGTTGVTQSTGDNSTKLATTAYVDGATSTMTSGDYTPTITNSANTSSITAITGRYIKMGARVFVTVFFTCNITSNNTQSAVEISLPFASSGMTSNSDIIGNGSYTNPGTLTAVGSPVQVDASLTDFVAYAYWYNNLGASISSAPITVNFSYVIK